MLSLRSLSHLPTTERQQHWDALDHDLDRCITPEVGRRLLSRTLSLIPVIRQSVRIFRRAAAEHFESQALGDQYGTLLAGAWSLQSSAVPTPEQARGLIASADWSSYQESVEVSDERRCLNTILEHQLRVETSERVHTRTIAELIGICSEQFPSPLEPVSPFIAEAVLGRHGIRVDGDQLLISNTASALAAILRDTAWASSWSAIVARLPGAARSGVIRFKGLGSVSRAVSIPMQIMFN
jgi:putative DNA primase/helicase